MAGWGYTKGIGPETWAEHYPAARGNRQTPIDISPAQAQYDGTLAERPLKIVYKPENTKTITNNGHSFQAGLNGEGSLLEGGPLQHKYQLAQFHVHWGKSDATGSEHTIDGQKYAAELHLVHWNTELFSNPGDAAKSDKGLAVLGIFLKPGNEHQGLKKITDLLSKVQYKNETVDFGNGFDPASLLPADKERYWTYEGSLTTPPCYESVSWIVFKDPIEVSPQQLTQFRELMSCERDCMCADEFDGHIVENYRTPLPLGERTVRASFNN